MFGQGQGGYRPFPTAYSYTYTEFKRIYPRIVKDAQGLKFMGYGVCEVPTDKKGVRKEIDGLIGKAIAN